MEEESVPYTDAPAGITPTEAPLYASGQGTSAGQSGDEGVHGKAPTSHENPRGKQRLSRYKDRARKRRQLQDLRKRLVPAGA
jgi:hypothetical protein